MEQKIVSELMSAGVLVTPELLEKLENGEETEEEIPESILAQFKNTKSPETAAFVEKTSNIHILQSYDKKPKKRTYDHFVKYWRHRFEALARMLRARQELQGVTSIARLQDGNVALIGMVEEKTITKNDNVILKLEDRTATATIIITGREPKLLEQAKNLVLDEVIGITGSAKEGTVFADKIIHPDVPLGKELKKQKDEEYMIVIGDPQVGNKHFLYEEWNNMAAWLRGEVGDEKQKNIAKKVKYAVVVGDLVEGVGVYPGQENDLSISDITEQYEEFAKIIKLLPDHIEIVACPGNHDAGRIAEPQGRLYEDFAKAVYEIPNMTLVSSPALVNIGKKATFPGFDVLVYHGYSLPYYADNIPKIRNAGGLKKVDQIMKFQLQRRHLAVTHGSNRYIPDDEEDPLVIDKVPDFYFTGHIHAVSHGNYRNVTMINAGAWTGITEDQIKRGMEPEPARLPIINLQTRQLTMMNFYLGEQ